MGIGHCRGLLAELVLRHDVKPNHLLVALNRELVLDVLDAQIRANRPVPVISSRGVSFPFHFQRERIVFLGGGSTHLSQRNRCTFSKERRLLFISVTKWRMVRLSAS